MSFRPPPPEVRCAAVVYRTGWNFFGSRCPQDRLAESDLCKRHFEMEQAGQTVQRVRPPQKVSA